MQVQCHSWWESILKSASRMMHRRCPRRLRWGPHHVGLLIDQCCWHRSPPGPKGIHGDREGGAPSIGALCIHFLPFFPFQVWVLRPGTRNPERCESQFIAFSFPWIASSSHTVIATMCNACFKTFFITQMIQFNSFGKRAKWDRCDI